MMQMTLTTQGGQVITLPETFVLDDSEIGKDLPGTEIPGRPGRIRYPGLSRVLPRMLNARAMIKGITRDEADDLARTFEGQLMGNGLMQLRRDAIDERFLWVDCRRVRHSYHPGRFRGALASFTIQFQADDPYWYGAEQRVKQLIKVAPGSSEWVEAEAPGDADLKFEGDSWNTWPDAQASGGKSVYSNTPGDYIVFTFRGTGVSWVSYEGSSAIPRAANVYIDDELDQEVDLSNGEGAWKVVYSKNGLTPGEHTITIELAESSQENVHVDALEVLTSAVYTITNTGNAPVFPRITIRPAAQPYFFDYKAKVAGSTVANKHKAWSQVDAGDPDPTTGWAEFDQYDYARIMFPGGTPASVEATVDGERPYIQGLFDLSDISDGELDTIEDQLERLTLKARHHGKGAVSGTFTPGIAYVDGKFGQGVAVQGKGSLAATGDLIEVNTSKWKHKTQSQGSISMWFRPEWSTGASGTKHFFGAVATGLFARYEVSGGTPRIIFYGHDSGQPYAYRNTPPITAGQWHHIVFRWDMVNSLETGNLLSITLDGSTVTTIAINTGSMSINDIVRFGADGDNGGLSLNGIMDDIAWFGRVLDADEMNAIYNAGTGRTADYLGDDDLLFYWNMNGSGRFATGESSTTLEGAAAGSYPQLEEDTTGAASGTTIPITDADEQGWEAGDEVVIAGANCLDFDGDNDGVSVPSNDGLLIGDNSFTWECLFRTTAGGAANDNALIINRSTGTTVVSGAQMGVPGGSIYFHMADGTNYASGSRGSGLNDGKWHHVAAVCDRDAQTVTIYIDGQATGDVIDCSSVGYINRKHLNFGSLASGDFHQFDGSMQEIRIWNIARSQADIQDNIRKQITGTQPGLVGYYKGNEGSGSTLGDSAEAINLVTAQQASFEDGTISGWTKSSFTSDQDVSTDWAYHGSYSLKVAKTLAAGADETHEIMSYAVLSGITPGDDYTFSTHVNLTARSNGDLRLGIQWRDSGNVAIGSRTTVAHATVSEGRLSITEEAPAGADNVQIMLLARCNRTVADGYEIEGYFDAIQVQKGETLTPWVPGGKTAFDGTITGGTWRGDGVLGAKSDRVTIAAAGVDASGLTVESAVTDTYGVGATVYRTKRNDGKPTNLLANGSFELPSLGGWIMTSSAADDYYSQDGGVIGQRYLRFQRVDAGARASQNIPMVGGVTYLIRGWARSSSVTSTNIRIFNGGDGWLSQNIDLPSSSWVLFEIVLEAPETATVSFQLYGNANGAVYEYDQVEVIPLSVDDGSMEASLNLLTANESNGGEDGTTTGFSPEQFVNISSTDAEATQGSRSIEVTTPGGDIRGVRFGSLDVDVHVGRTFASSIWIKGEVGTTLTVLLRTGSSGSQYDVEVINPTGDWEEVQLSYTIPESPLGTLNLWVRSTDATTFYIDKSQIQLDSLTSWEEGDENNQYSLSGVAPGFTGGGNAVFAPSLDSHTGNKSQSISNSDGAYSDSLRKVLSLVTNRKYLFSFWHKRVDGTGELHLTLGNNTVMSSKTVPGSDTWAKYSVLIDTYGGSSSGFSPMYFWIDDVNTEILVDDVQLIEFEPIDIEATPCSEANSYEDGQWNEALHVGYGDELTFPTDRFTEGEGSFSLWIKPRDDWDGEDPTYTSRWLLGIRTDHNADDLQVFYYQPSGSFRVKTNGGLDKITAAQAVDAGTWYHVLFSWSSGSTKLYVNGTLLDTGDDLDDYTLTPTFMLGSLPSGENYANALLDGLQIWDRQLSDQEVSDLFDSGTEPELDDDTRILANFNTSLATAGPDAVTAGSVLEVWNGAAWVEVAENDSADPEEQTWQITSGFSTYIEDETKGVRWRVKSKTPSNGDLAATVYADYASLEAIHRGTVVNPQIENLGRNLLVNPKFDDDLDGWTASSPWAVLYHGDGYYGDKCVRLTSDNSGTSILAQTVNVEAGQYYALSAWYKAITYAGNFRFRVTWADRDGGNISTDTINLGSFTSWTQIQDTFRAPRNAVKATIQISEGADTGDFLMDGFQFEQADTADDTATGFDDDSAQTISVTKTLVENQVVRLECEEGKVYMDGVAIQDAVNLQFLAERCKLHPGKNQIEVSHEGSDLMEVVTTYRPRWH